MNILYITNYIDIARCGGFINDYLNDLVFYGFQEKFGNNVVDSTPIISLYKQNQNSIPKKYLWGGMTAFWLIDQDTVDRSNILEKILNKFYDFIIYGSIQRCKNYYDIVSKIYPDNKIILIDGNDDINLDPLYHKHLYFKRELVHKNHKNLLPISFSIPSSKLCSNPIEKKQLYATCIPGNKQTYIFSNEKDYYADYQRSYFGITTKKAGWDCMRHYEILANRCIPDFHDIEACPDQTLLSMPKDLLLEARPLITNFDKTKYTVLLNDIFEYTKNNLTTKHIAEYIINKL
jgi:hypothetical protein